MFTKQHRILIVDDDPDTCTLLDLLFTQKGFNTSIAYCGHGAIDLVKEKQPDVILLDFTMPDMDGIMTFELLRENSLAPVIFLTADQSGSLASRVLESGASDYVRKPFHKEELFARVRKQLESDFEYETAGVVKENKKNIITSIVIPVYNEEEALPVVLESVRNVIDETYEVIVVDDGSSDGSVKIAADSDCTLIRHDRNQGKGAALQTGIRASAGRNIIFIDADNTYPVEYIPEMANLMGSFDLVRGARVLGRNNIPIINRLGNFLFDGVIRTLHSVKGGDILSGMYGVSRESLSRLNLTSDGFDIEAEIGVKAEAHGLRMTTVPITYSERIGEKKLKVIRDGIRILYRILQLALTYNPMIAFILPGAIFLMLGMVSIITFLISPAFMSNSSQLVYISGGFANLGVQIVILGLAVYIAGVAYGLRGRANNVLDLLAGLFYKRGLMVAGVFSGAAGFTGLVWDFLRSWISGAPLFSNIPIMVLMATLMVLGVQILISMAFFSALRGLEHNLTTKSEPVKPASFEPRSLNGKH